MIDALNLDLRYALRSLSKTPAVSVLIFLTTSAWYWREYRDVQLCGCRALPLASGTRAFIPRSNFFLGPKRKQDLELLLSCLQGLS